MSSSIVASPQKYPYRPLVGSDSIRLLLIQPSKTEEIHCSLVHTTLYACRLELFDHYTALSYVWGDLTNPKIVWVDGIAISVTSNLHAALCDLRDESRVFRLWVDALCINQSDLGEKGIQVAMMGKIYAAADRTVIHLGRPDNADDSVLRNLELYFGQLLVQDEDSTQVESLHEQAVKLILSAPWFRRVWILQELVLSKEPLVQYGRHRVSWDDFCRFLGPVKRQGLSRGMSTHQLVAEMRDLRERFQENKGEIRMIDILLSRKGLGVTEPRDMLYAHKGLASDAGNLEIDYTESCAGLLPSWCPDWSQAPSIPKFPRGCPGRTPDLVDPGLSEDSPKDEVAKRAFRESHALFQHQESKVLTCLGIEVADVTHLSNPLSSESMERTKREYFSSKLMSLRKSWRESSELGVERSTFEATHWNSYSHVRHDIWGPRKITGSFSAGIKQHIKSLKDLYVDIYKAWQSIISNELILPSLTSSSILWTKESEISDTIDGELEKSGFLSDERIFAFGCWIFLDGEETLYDERAASPSRHVDLPIYRLQHESTVDLLIQYFLPGFDKSIIDGKVLAQTTLSAHSLFICPATTAVGDHIYNLLPMSYPDSFSHFVLRARLHEEPWVKDNIHKLSPKLGPSGQRQDRAWRISNTWRLRRELNVEDLAVVTCSFLGEAYGTTNMYREYSGDIRFEPQEWRRLSDKILRPQKFRSLYAAVPYKPPDESLIENVRRAKLYTEATKPRHEFFTTEEKILAIF